MLSCLSETEKMLGIHVQNLEKFSKTTFIDKLKNCYKNKLDKSMANIKISSNDFTMPYYLNAGTCMSKVKRSLI